MGIPDIDVDVHRRHVVVVAEGPDAADDLKALKPFIKEYQPVLVGVGAGADVLRKRRLPTPTDRRRSRDDERRGAPLRSPGGAARRCGWSRKGPGTHPRSRHRRNDLPGGGIGRRPRAAAVSITTARR